MVNFLVVASTLALVYLGMQLRTSSYFLEASQLQLLVLLPTSTKNPTKKKSKII